MSDEKYWCLLEGLRTECENKQESQGGEESENCLKISVPDQAYSFFHLAFLIGKLNITALIQGIINLFSQNS